MKKVLLCSLVMVLLLGLVACALPAVNAEVLKSDKARITSPQVDEADLAALVRGNSTFAFDLYQELRNGTDNVFYSPYSISLALAMTYAGARGETEEQMKDTLHFTLPQDRLHPAFNALDQELTRRGEGAWGKDEGGFRLNIANAIWGQKDYEFLSSFLDLLAENYGAGLRVLDFAGEPEQSRITINDWVSAETEGRIEDLLPPGSITPLTGFVLTNAIYFNAAWQYPFYKDSTSDGPFYLLDGQEVTVPMMKEHVSLNYDEGENYQAVELPYDGRELSMIILLPERDEFEAFEESLDVDRLDDILEGMQPRPVALTMPRFEFESSFSLTEILAEGMPDAFYDADFSGMTGGQDLAISDVVHKAFISVDEAGTEAAAGAAVIMPGYGLQVAIDHPFIFLIRDIETGTILFVGRVMNPAA